MSYKYLGIELDNHLNFRLARETIRRKARKGIVLATNAYWKGINARAGEQVWEQMIRPIIEYASEIWFTGKETDLERLQLQVGKALLGVGQSCASEVVRGELAWWRLASRADFTKLKFWARLVNISKEGLLSKSGNKKIEQQ